MLPIIVLSSNISHLLHMLCSVHVILSLMFDGCVFHLAFMILHYMIVLLCDMLNPFMHSVPKMGHLV